MNVIAPYLEVPYRGRNLVSKFCCKNYEKSSPVKTLALLFVLPEDGWTDYLVFLTSVYRLLGPPTLRGEFMVRLIGSLTLGICAGQDLKMDGWVNFISVDQGSVLVDVDDF